MQGKSGVAGGAASSVRKNDGLWEKRYVTETSRAAPVDNAISRQVHDSCAGQVPSQLIGVAETYQLHSWTLRVIN